MSIYADHIAEAVEYSRHYGEIATVHMADLDGALDALIAACTIGEEYDYVRNGDVLEFWAYDADDDDSMTMRVHVLS